MFVKPIARSYVIFLLTCKRYSQTDFFFFPFWRNNPIRACAYKHTHDFFYFFPHFSSDGVSKKLNMWRFNILLLL